MVLKIPIKEALEKKLCASCGGPVSYFRSRRAIEEYNRIAHCQDCQDGINNEKNN